MLTGDIESGNSEKLNVNHSSNNNSIITTSSPFRFRFISLIIMVGLVLFVAASFANLEQLDINFDKTSSRFPLMHQSKKNLVGAMVKCGASSGKGAICQKDLICSKSKRSEDCRCYLKQTWTKRSSTSESMICPTGNLPSKQ